MSSSNTRTRRITSTIRILNENEDKGTVHLPGALNQNETVCGWVDVRHKELDPKEHPPNCHGCLQIVKELREMRLADGSLPGGDR